LITSCGSSDGAVVDFRLDFVGIYDCDKGSTTIELEVVIDPENENNLLVGPYSIPIDADGSFGPEKIEDDVIIELRFDDDFIFYKETKIIINGLVAPCELEGKKRT